MRLTAHQPCYLPWLGLFKKIATADTFVLFDEVQYQPKDYNNRNKIWSPQGPMWLTVPVYTNGHRLKTINQIEINNTLPWQRKHWKSIEQSYRKAPYWHSIATDLEWFYQSHWTHLTELNHGMLKYFLDVLGITVVYDRASKHDFRGQKSALVLDMCQQMGASTYIFGALGKDYADVAAFEGAGIEVRFQDYQHPTYVQFGGEFQSHLSIIDALFHHGHHAKDILMGTTYVER